MATTVQYTASLKTRKTTSSSNAKNGVATQEFYASGENFVGIICFSGMNLANKVVTGITLTVKANAAGYGAGSTKTVYMRKATHQDYIWEGVTGAAYAGDALGTFTGSFYNNTTANAITGELLAAMGAYISQGNNTFTLYNPSPSASSQGYSTNYLQWNSVTITVTYEEGVSTPTVSAASADLGSAVTVFTNRQSSGLTHTVSYSFGGAFGTIATGVGDSVSWTPPLSLASQIPNAVSGACVITCQSYSGSTLTGSRTCSLTLTVPASVVPTISAVAVTDANSAVAQSIGQYVKLLSRLEVAVSASGAYGSGIASCRTVIDGVTYSSASFISNALTTAGNGTLSVTVTDSRGRTATYTRQYTVLDYSYPSIRQFSAGRCSADGSAAQVDGNRVHYSFDGSVSALNSQNTIACTLYYKLTSASAWVQAEQLSASGYSAAAADRLLAQTFDPLASYDIKVRLQDRFYEAEQQVSIGTKQVILDFKADGSGIGIGKVAETSGRCEVGWPLSLMTPLAVSEGGTGAGSADAACANLGAVKKAGDTMTGDLGIQTVMTPSLVLKPTSSGTGYIVRVEGSYVGSASLGVWEDDTGNNRRMLEVRAADYDSSMDSAVLLRKVVNGTWTDHRVFHDGMTSGVPVSKGGTGATDAAAARANLGCDDAGNISTGTLAMARLPFKVAYGSGTVSSSTALSLNYAAAGFTAVPCVFVCYSTTGTNWAGDNGALKVYSKTATGASVIVGGTFTTARAVDWYAIGV